MGNQNGFSIAFAVVSLLSCCQASSFFLPRVSRTDDAIIIDLDGSGYAAPFQSKNWYGQVANPGFIPVPSFGPYPMMFRQPSGWPYPSVYPNSLNPTGFPSYKQFNSEDEEEEPTDIKQAPAASTCGTGPATMPPPRALATGRLIGAADAKKGAWPFMVALKKSDDTIPFCSGTLLSDSKILVAAQCLEKMSLIEINSVTALIGMYLADQSDVQMTRRISKVVVHEKYNAFNFANDIAILTMDTPVPLSKTVAPACLPPLQNTDPDQYVDASAVILGWGPAGPVNPTKLQQALVGFMSNTDCKADANIGKYDTDTTLCITSDKNDKFTCPADVGGPVVTLLTPGGWTVIGINSYTKDCGTSGLKTKVSSFRDWIDKYMK